MKQIGKKTLRYFGVVAVLSTVLLSYQNCGRRFILGSAINPVITGEAIPLGNSLVNVDSKIVSGWAYDPEFRGVPITVRVKLFSLEEAAYNPDEAAYGVDIVADQTISIPNLEKVEGHGFQVDLTNVPVPAGDYEVRVFAKDPTTGEESQINGGEIITIGDPGAPPTSPPPSVVGPVLSAPPIGKITSFSSTTIRGFCFDPDEDVAGNKELRVQILMKGPGDTTFNTVGIRSTYLTSSTYYVSPTDPQYGKTGTIRNLYYLPDTGWYFSYSSVVNGSGAYFFKILCQNIKPDGTSDPDGEVVSSYQLNK